MIKSFFKLSLNLSSQLPKSAFPVAPHFFFAGAKVDPAKAAPAGKAQAAGGKPAAGGAPGAAPAGAGGSNTKVQSFTRFIGVPQRDPMEEGEWQDYPKLTENQILNILGK